MVDEQVGRLIDELDNLQLRQNTLIVYTSDHGQFAGHHGLPFSKGNATVPQNFFDEAIRVPLLVDWPGHVRAGISPNQFVDHCDLFQTLLAAADARAEGIPSPGRSFLPLLNGQEMSWRDAQFCEYGNARMIRTKTHKLICRYPGPNGHFGDELYDLTVDPRETHNVIGDPVNSERVGELKRRLDDYFARYEVPERSGRHVALQPQAGAVEPWRS
jgi:arylsulfatase A-like enzyme